MKTSKIISVGFAMFAMLFGAGNVIYPLALGRDIGDKLLFGLLGFVVTAVIFPLLGLVATMLCDGEYKNILGKLGRIPGFIIALVCMILIGPFAITPRCITVAHASVKVYMPNFTIFYFSMLCAVMIFLCTIKRSAVVDLLGKFLGPLKLTLLLGIIIKGLMFPASLIQTSMTGWEGFSFGFDKGYGTGDLLATIFFSGLILSGLRKGIEDELDYKTIAWLGLKAGVVGALLLGLVYTGFCVVAAFYGNQIAGIPDGDIFGVLAGLVLGQSGGVLANITVAVSCLTTAIALTTVFATYLSKELFCGKISYIHALLVTVVIMAVMSNFGFAGIMKMLMPVISILYPSLIILSLVSSAQVLFGFKWIKTPVFVTFGLTIVMQYWPFIQPLICK